MIESTIINWIDLGDSIQKIDIYGKKKLSSIYKIFRILKTQKLNSTFLIISLNFLFFVQNGMYPISTFDSKSTSDTTIYIYSRIKYPLFLHNYITSKTGYIVGITLETVLTIICIASFIILIINTLKKLVASNFTSMLLDLITKIVFYYLADSFISLFLMSINCPNGIHYYLKTECFVSTAHILIFILSIFNFLFWILLMYVYAFSAFGIGNVNENKFLTRINCNYEIFMITSKIMFTFVSYFINKYSDNSTPYKIILDVVVMINSIFYSVYFYKYVLFYNNGAYFFQWLGWVFLFWFSFVVLLKILFKISDITLFNIIGFILLSVICYYLNKNQIDYLLTDFDIYDAKTLKEVELFNYSLYNLLSEKSYRSKSLLKGIIRKFEDLSQTDTMIEERFTKLNKSYSKYNQYYEEYELSIISIIYFVYSYHLEKSVLKNDVLLAMCYFLINILKNPVYAVSLCSKYKVVNIKHMYLKYNLMEDLKDYLISKIVHSENKDNIKQVQISSVILYNIYIGLFKLKIFDASTDQIDYFDFLRSNVTTTKTTENFLKLGEGILTLRKEILKLWEKIVELNPFSDEVKKDYLIYLKTILQDEILAKAEMKNYETIKSNKLSERSNVYHTMFIKDLSSIMLIDGFSSIYKILYTTPNFPDLFGYNSKEILNLTLNDLLPPVIADIHKELVDDVIQYSNMNFSFKSLKDVFLKGKNNGGIFPLKLYVKCMPNLSYGLIYICYLQKIQDNTFLILLDKDFKICSLSDMLSGSNATLNNYYGLVGLNNHYLSTIVPEMLNLLEYKNDKFNFTKSEMDLKGKLYDTTPTREIDTKISMILDKIKSSSKTKSEEDENELAEMYEDLVSKITANSKRVYNIFYKIEVRKFLDGKYNYHRVYISNDLASIRENSGATADNINNNKQYDFGRNQTTTTLFNNEEANPNDKVKLTQKEIFLKKDTSEYQKLLVDTKSRNDKDKTKKNEKLNFNNGDNNKGENNNNVLDIGGDSSSSVNTKSSSESSNFIKLKNWIIEKKELSNIKIMKILCLIFFVVSIILGVLEYKVKTDNLTNLHVYLNQNIFFNQTKIIIECIYYNALNLKWVRDDYKEQYSCQLIESGDCREFYNNLLSQCIYDMRKIKKNSTSFSSDYKDILTSKIHIQPLTNNDNKRNDINIDVDSLLNLISSNAMKFNSNLDHYFQFDKDYDVINQNIREQTLIYINNQTISGFEDNIKQKQISKFKKFPFFLVIDILFFIIIVSCFVWLIIKLYELESFYLEKLIKFKSTNFDNYLKNLEELKKKIREDSGEEEDKANNDMEMNELNSKNEKNNEKENAELKKKQTATKEDEDAAKDEENKKIKGNKEKNKLQNKLIQQRKEKLKIMSYYFFRSNIFFIVKLSSILFISVIFFIVSTVLEVALKNKYIDFESTTSQIEKIYKKSYDIYLEFLTELESYEDLEYKKLIYNNTNEQWTYYASKDDYKKNISTLCQGNNTGICRYSLHFKSSTEIEVPKLENLLMSMLTNLDTSNSEVKTLNNLYNSDACDVLLSSYDKNRKEYTVCQQLWSNILLKGIEQSLTQMGVSINAVIDELDTLKQDIKSFQEIVMTNTSFADYTTFMEYFFLNSFIKTIDLFGVLKNDKVQQNLYSYSILLTVFCICVAILFFVLLLFVYTSIQNFNLFLNFIGIIPFKYLQEDEKLLHDLLKLEHHIF